MSFCGLINRGLLVFWLPFSYDSARSDAESARATRRRFRSVHCVTRRVESRGLHTSSRELGIYAGLDSAGDFLRECLKSTSTARRGSLRGYAAEDGSNIILGASWKPQGGGVSPRVGRDLARNRRPPAKFEVEFAIGCSVCWHAGTVSRCRRRTKRCSRPARLSLLIRFSSWATPPRASRRLLSFVFADFVSRGTLVIWHSILALATVSP